MLSQSTKKNNFSFIESNFRFNKSRFLLTVSLTAADDEVATSGTVRQEGNLLLSLMNGQLELINNYFRNL